MKAKRIWLLDDDWVSNLIHEVMIGHFQPKWEVELFTQPTEVVALYRELYQLAPELLPDVLFLDLNMPRMNGWELLEEFADLERVCPIIILTSSIGKEDMEKSEQHPMVHSFVSKPLRMTHLMRLFPAEGSKTSIHSHLISPSQ